MKTCVKNTFLSKLISRKPPSEILFEKSFVPWVSWAFNIFEWPKPSYRKTVFTHKHLYFRSNSLKSFSSNVSIKATPVFEMRKTFSFSFHIVFFFHFAFHKFVNFILIFQKAYRGKYLIGSFTWIAGFGFIRNHFCYNIGFNPMTLQSLTNVIRGIRAIIYENVLSKIPAKTGRLRFI